MKKVFLLVMASMLLTAGTAMAQNTNNKNHPKPLMGSNVNTANNNRNQSNLDKGEKGEYPYFIGAIDYELKMDKKAPKAPEKDKAQPAVAKESKIDFKAAGDKNVVPNKKFVADRMGKRGLVFFTKECTVLTLGDFSYFKLRDKAPIMGYRFKDQNIGFEMRIESPRVKDPERKELMNKYYKRTDKVREIAGQKAVLYLSNLPHQEGEIWVCEDKFLAEDFGPFEGMIHPVLQATVNIVVEDKVVDSYMINAINVFDKKVDEMIVKKAFPQEIMPVEEFVNRLMEAGYLR